MAAACRIKLTFERHLRAQGSKTSRKAHPARSPHIREATPTTAQKTQDAPAHNKLEDKLISKLSDPKLFDAGTCESSGALGIALSNHVFKGLTDGGEPNPMIQGCKELLADRKQLKSDLNSALSHLPASERADAVDAVIKKLENRLCDSIQNDTAKIVKAQVAIAQDKVAPFCTNESPERLQLATGLISAQPPLSEDAICKRLEAVGIPPSEAADLAEQLADVRKDPELVAQLNAGLKGDKSGEAWDKGVVYDGALKNLDESIQDAFKEMKHGLNRVATQVGNDQVRGDAMFTSPLAAQALGAVLKANDINPSKQATSGADQLIHQRTKSRQDRERYEGWACTAVVTLAGLAAPGMGLIAGMALSGMSATPGVMISTTPPRLAASRAPTTPRRSLICALSAT